MPLDYKVIPVGPQFIGSFLIPNDDYLRRKYWHTISERTERVPVDKSLVGKKARIDRFIIRTGYFFKPTDVSYLHIKKTVDEIVKRTLIASGIKEVEDFMVTRLIDKLGFSMLNRPLYEARRLWVSEGYSQEQYKGYLHLRAFWYVDVKDVNPEPVVEVEITGIKSHWTGFHYPPESYHYSGPDGEDYDYTPGGLQNALYQQVYQAYGLVARNYDSYYDGNVEIHPLDIKEVL